MMDRCQEHYGLEKGSFSGLGLTRGLVGKVHILTPVACFSPAYTAVEGSPIRQPVISDV